MKIVFMGTPDFAAEILKAVWEENETLEAVFTQPDKPVGRKQIMTPPPVKVLAESYGVPVYQPRRIKRPRWVELLQDMAPDLIVVAAYGQILSKEILDIPRFGCINIHASLLPRYRGAAPIQWCIVNGETVTGVTAMQMDVGLDTGDMMIKQEVNITGEDTGESLHDKLAAAGAKVIREVIRRLEKGEKLPREKQLEEAASYAPILKKEDGLICWERSAKEIDCQIRGFYPWPGAFTYWNDKKLTIEKAVPLEMNSENQPGYVLLQDPSEKRKKLWIQTGDGVLQVEMLQMQGKKSMEADAFLRGNALQGERLGE